MKIFIFTIPLIFLDQLTKYLAATYLNTPFSLIENFFKFQYSENFGVAFSIPIPFTIIIILNFILIAALIYIAKKELNLKIYSSQILIAFVISGGISNLIDRIFRGYVVDFISIWKYPIFNLADIYITTGILAIIIFYGKITRTEKHKNQK